MKHFTLPKEFAEKWVKALESGEYEQGEETLVNADYERDEDGIIVSDSLNMDNCTFCCLGVAAVVVGVDPLNIIGYDLLHEVDKTLPEELPSALIYEGEDLVDLLSSLNDGIPSVKLHKYKEQYPNLVFHIERPSSGIPIYTFKDIAQFIKTNIEFKP